MNTKSIFLKIFFVLMLSIGGIVSFADNIFAVENYTILMYGMDTCWNCRQMKKNLDAASIKYTFYDVNKDATKNQEMWDKVAKAKVASGGSVTTPIMDVNGTVLMHPSFEKVKQLIGKK
jgi:glutaredoxin